MKARKGIFQASLVNVNGQDDCANCATVEDRMRQGFGEVDGLFLQGKDCCVDLATGTNADVEKEFLKHLLLDPR